MTNSSLVFVLLLLLVGCSGSNGAHSDLGVPVDSSRPHDRGNEADQRPDAGSGPLQCGAHEVVQGGCGARCPAPCVCVTFFDETLVPFELCGTPCHVPGSCPADERCSVIIGNAQPSSQPVCLPQVLQTPDDGAKALVDCIDLLPSMTAPRCRGSYLTQMQTFYCHGGVGGAYCADVLLETCPGGCVTPDAGAPGCNGAPDAGGPAATDAGVACCPSSIFGSCRMLGGAKLPPHGCRMLCCNPPCQWTKGTDSHGCATWTPVPPDAGGPG